MRPPLLPVGWLVLTAAFWTGSVAAAEAPAPRCQERPGQVGYLGFSSRYEVEDGAGEVRVLSVTPGSPADRAGFAAGDSIVAIEGRPFLDADKLEHGLAARARRPGDVHRYTVRREDRVSIIEVVLEEPPEGWRETFFSYLQHQEMEVREEGHRRLDRLSARGPVELTFRRGRDCRFLGVVEGKPASLPLTLAAALRVIPVLERLRAGDSLTLRVQVSGNVVRADPVDLPSYLEPRDVLKAIQETAQRDRDHYH